MYCRIGPQLLACCMRSPTKTSKGQVDRRYRPTAKLHGNFKKFLKARVDLWGLIRAQLGAADERTGRQGGVGCCGVRRVTGS